MNRRTFLRAAAAASAAAALAACQPDPTGEPVAISIPASTQTPTILEPTQLLSPSPTPAPDKATVFLIRTEDRRAGVERAFELLAPELAGKRVLIKPNFNSADPPPGSTDPAMLEEAVLQAWNRGADVVQIGDRSGMGATNQVMERLGVPALVDDHNVEWIDFSSLPADQWELMTFEGSHWADGFAIARPVLEAGAIINLCCLKTHRFGGHFTLSLKNSVGMVASEVPGLATAFMQQLHNSSFQRSMIAEINLAYQPDVIVMDGIDAFTSGGPDTGTSVHPGIILAGTDRVAVDAAGVALLRVYGTTPEVSQGRIFDQEQIRRAVELGLGVEGPDRIELVGDDEARDAIRAELYRS